VRRLGRRPASGSAPISTPPATTAASAATVHPVVRSPVATANRAGSTALIRATTGETKPTGPAASAA
jgi:hypothetical protein